MPEPQSLTFGRHKGVLITRVPLSYLKWMVCAGTMQAELAEEELKRRGTVTPELDIAIHAVDRASLRLRRRWHETRGQDEGLYSWLVRMATEALKDGKKTDSGVFYQGMRFIFDRDGVWPVLKTVMPAKK